MDDHLNSRRSRRQRDPPASSSSPAPAVARNPASRPFASPRSGCGHSYDPMQLATPEAYLRDPVLVWTWYEHRFGTTTAAEPNPGHAAIAELERLRPSVTVVTQNIDGLHQRAGSSDVIELHGSMNRFKCIHGRHCGYSFDDFADQAAEAASLPRVRRPAASRGGVVRRGAAGRRHRPGAASVRRLRRDAGRRHVGRRLSRRGHAAHRRRRPARRSST